MAVRGIVAAAEIEPADVTRIIARGSELGVEIVHEVAETSDELLAVLRRNPSADVLLSDFLPDVAGSASMYSFGKADDDAEAVEASGPRAAGGADAAGAAGAAGAGDAGPADAAARAVSAAEEDALAAAAALRWVQLPSVGVNQEAGSVVWRRAPSVAVTTASGLASVAMAQYVTASILFHAHRLWRMNEYHDQRDWTVRGQMQPQILIGRTVGLLGYGGVGRRVAHIARGLGMRVVAVRRSPDRPVEDLYRRPEIEALDAGPEPAEIRGLDQMDWLLGEADYLVSTVPLTAESRGLIGARELGLLRPGAVVINVSRGPVFDEDALIAGLTSGRLGGVSLDVFREEPLPADSPLWDLPNAMVTPHVSGTHDHVSEFTTDLFLDNLARYLEGQPLLNVADRSRGY